jgi:hypothetical protein
MRRQRKPAAREIPSLPLPGHAATAAFFAGNSVTGTELPHRDAAEDKSLVAAEFRLPVTEFPVQ